MLIWDCTSRLPRCFKQAERASERKNVQAHWKGQVFHSGTNGSGKFRKPWTTFMSSAASRQPNCRRFWWCYSEWQSKHKGFGLVTWHTCTKQGEPVAVKVLCYFLPDIPLRLFSPQDYAQYHQQCPNTTLMIGSQSWFCFKHEACTSDEPKIIRSTIKLVVPSIRKIMKCFSFVSDTLASGTSVSWRCA